MTTTTNLTTEQEDALLQIFPGRSRGSWFGDSSKVLDGLAHEIREGRKPEPGDLVQVQYTPDGVWIPVNSSKGTYTVGYIDGHVALLIRPHLPNSPILLTRQSPDDPWVEPYEDDDEEPGHVRIRKDQR